MEIGKTLLYFFNHTFVIPANAGILYRSGILKSLKALNYDCNQIPAFAGMTVCGVGARC